MLHRIPVEQSGVRGKLMADAVQTCVHCGFCLPTCPTYQVLGEEADSPRGRIVLMKQVLEGDLAPEEAAPHLDRCLGCLACETYCPSGVPYSQLLSPYRDLQREKSNQRPSLARWMALQTLPFPWRFRWALRLGRIAKKWNLWTPAALQPMLQMIPDQLPKVAQNRQTIYRPRTTVRARVALLEGCAQRVLAPEIHQAAIEVLIRNGVEVHVPPRQGCCGALAWHVGDGTKAQQQAEKNLKAFEGEFDAIVSTAAGCGSAMHEYPVLFEGSPTQKHAVDFASKSCDILTYLDRIGIEPPPAFTRTIRVGYHDACHLAHAQRETAAPRRLLESIENLELIPIPDSDLCCGSAGIYNIEQPEIADSLGRSKAAAIRQSRCDLVALANIGCQMQIARHLQQESNAMPVLHVVQILAAAYEGRPLL
jgi:glycolate oxidase iron-sulfur subunit